MKNRVRLVRLPKTIFLLRANYILRLHRKERGGLHYNMCVQMSLTSYFPSKMKCKTKTLLKKSSPAVVKYNINP